ncbi:MAG: hypothetical protein ABW128_15875 [Rhizorhabdus sp.]
MIIRSRAMPETAGKADRHCGSAVSLQIRHCPPMARQMVLHEFDIMRVISFRVELEIGIDVQAISGDAFKKVDAVISGNDMPEAFCEILQRRSRPVPVFRPMNMLVDAEQQVGQHIAVQKQQRMAG